MRGLEAAGHAEIVLTGVQISAYRDGDARLPQLLDAVLAATSTCRIRLTSIAPWELDAPLLDRLAHPRLCRHVHLSLQSGDDRTLRRMRRPYTAARFAQVAAAVRERVPGIALTTDVIVGFPGETDAEHEASRRFVASTGFARVHVFSYSPRLGTEAATLPVRSVPKRKRARMTEMLETATAAEDAFRRAPRGHHGARAVGRPARRTVARHHRQLSAGLRRDDEERSARHDHRNASARSRARRSPRLG